MTSLKCLQHLCSHHKDEHKELQAAKKKQKLVSPPSHSSQSKQITITQSFSHAVGYGSMCAIVAVLMLIFIFITKDSLHHKTINNALVKMLVLDMQPANIVHDERLKTFSRLLIPSTYLLAIVP